jgi:hypothetical protein
MNMQDDEEETKETSQFPEVMVFLKSVSLEKYEDRFLQNGFEDEESILELNDTHLDCLFIPLGHKLKILKRIKVIRQEKGMPVVERAESK